VGWGSQIFIRREATQVTEKREVVTGVSPAEVGMNPMLSHWQYSAEEKQEIQTFIRNLLY
jgi:hypothetical protein